MQRWPIVDWRRWQDWRRWPVESRFEARLSDLWETPIVEVDLARWTEVCQQRESTALTGFNDVHSDAQRLYIQTCHAFDEGLPKRYYDYAKQLEVRCGLKKRLDYWRSKISGTHCVGVHIRSIAAHVNTREVSTVEWFEEKISEILRRNSRIMFFLSTDRLEVQDRLVGKYFSHIWHQDEMPAYNSARAVQKALVDLHVLGMTDFILGSYQSSFSYMAAGFQGGRAYQDARRAWGSTTLF